MQPRLDFFNAARIREGRLPWIDYARAIAIFLVLYRHIFEGINRSGIDISHYLYLEHANVIFYSFRMPLFFIISGVFIGSSLAKRGLVKFIDSKWRTLLYPYLIWAFIQVSLQLIFSRYVNADRDYRDYLYIFYAPRELDQFWYLYALFNTSVLYAFLLVKGKLRKWQHIVLGLVMFYGSCLLAEHKINLGFVYDVLHYYLFIALGDTMSSYVLDKKNVPFFSSWKLFFILLPLFAVGQWYFLHTNLQHPGATDASKYSYVEDFQPLMYLVIALCGCCFMANWSFLLQRYGNFVWLRMLGYYSLYIYLMHVVASSAIRILLVRVLHLHNVPALLVTGILGGLFLPIIFYNLAMRVGAWWLFSPVKERTFKEAKYGAT
jgi:fucose 4-O-acetylase-like acetyltransferase